MLYLSIGYYPIFVAGYYFHVVAIAVVAITVVAASSVVGFAVT